MRAFHFGLWILDFGFAARPKTKIQNRGASWATRFGLALLLLFTFSKGVLWSGLVAPLDAPDEPSHFNYIVQIRDGTWLPVVDMVLPGGLRTPPSTPLNQDARDYFARHNYKFFRSMPYESAQ